MKKKILIGIAVIFGSITLLGLILYVTGPKLFFSQVERVEFQGHNSCGGPISETVVLSDSEARKAVFYYDIAAYWGHVDAESCVSDFSFKIYLKNGDRISLIEAGSPRIKVCAPNRDYIWINSPFLAAYAKELISKYDIF